jgi:hypothetical protein
MKILLLAEQGEVVKAIVYLTLSVALGFGAACELRELSHDNGLVM